MTEQDALAVWLRQRGVSEHDVDVYRRALQAVRNVVPSRRISETEIGQVLELERTKGATQRRLDNLAYIGQKLVRFSAEIDCAQLIKNQPLELVLQPDEPRSARGTPAPPHGPAPMSPITGRPMQAVMPKPAPRTSRRTAIPNAIPDAEKRGNCTCLGGTKDTRVEEGPDMVSRDLLAMLGIVCIGLGMIKGIAVFLGIAAACAVVGYGLARRLQGVQFLCLRCRGTIEPRGAFEQAEFARVGNSLKVKMGALGFVALANASIYFWMINHTTRAVSGG